MGDRRYDRAYAKVRGAGDPERVLREMPDDEVVEALAAASRAADPLLANILATSALNRMRRLRAALVHLGEGVVALGPRGEVQWSNPAADAILGWDRAAAIGRPFEDTVRHLDAAGVPVPIERCQLMRTVFTGQISHFDGDIFEVAGRPAVCVEYTSAPIIVEEDEGPIGAVIAFRDCGERKRAERALQEGRERYKSLFDNLPQPIISVGRDATVIDANVAAEEMTGRTIEMDRGKSFTDFVHPDDVARVMDLFELVVRGSRERAKMRIVHRDGHYFPIEAMGVPVILDGEVVGVHGIVLKWRED